jgi:hypothetical protein
MDLFVVPTIGFDLLYALVIVRLDRRELVWISVTTHPTAEWVVRQITEAFPWDEAPHYLIRDRDRIYGSVVTRRLRAMGIRDNTARDWTKRAIYREVEVDGRQVLAVAPCPEDVIASKLARVREGQGVRRSIPCRASAESRFDRRAYQGDQA